MSSVTPIAEGRCPKCKQLGPAIDLLCDHCGAFLIKHDRQEKLSAFILLVSALTALVVFHSTASPWPMYFFIAIGIIHLYAILFSRGAALLSAAVVSGVGTAGWLIWELSAYLIGRESVRADGAATTLAGAPSAVQASLLVVLWLGGAAWAYRLGRTKAMPGTELASSFFLGMGAFALGLWGTWSVVLGDPLFRMVVYQFVLLLSLLVPLGLLIYLVKHYPYQRRKTGVTPKTEVIALWLIVGGAYLSSTQLLTDAVKNSLGAFMPRLLGAQVITDIELPLLLQILSFRNPIPSVFAATAVANILASSAAQAAIEFVAHKPEWLTHRLRAIRHDYLASRNTVNKFVLQSIGGLLELLGILITFIQFSSLMSVKFVETCAREARRLGDYGLRMIRYLVVPLIAFSVLAISVIHVLIQFTLYIRLIHFPDPRVLWAEALVVMILVGLLCAACFGLAPGSNRRFLFAGVEAAYLGFIVYFTLSLASLTFLIIWFGFQSNGLDLVAVRPGGVYWTNLVCASVMLVGFAVAENQAVWFRGVRRAISRIRGGPAGQPSPTAGGSAAAVGAAGPWQLIESFLALAFAAAILGFGLPPLASAMMTAAGLL